MPPFLWFIEYVAQLRLPLSSGASAGHTTVMEVRVTITESYGVFVVRVWREPTEAGKEPWRASVLNTATKGRAYFTSSEDLVAFLSPWPLGEEALLWR